MTFRKSRKITIERPKSRSGAGRKEYSGYDPTESIIIVSNVPASIQEKRVAHFGDIPILPLDGAKSSWTIFINSRDGRLVKYKDIATDDLGQRYQILAVRPMRGNRIQLYCDHLEA